MVNATSTSISVMGVQTHPAVEASFAALAHVSS